MDEKTKSFFNDMISNMNETKSRIDTLQKEQNALVEELAICDARLHNDWLAENIAKSSVKRPCTKENWEAMFDDMFELCSIIEQAKLPRDKRNQWGYVYSGYCAEGDCRMYPLNKIQQGDAVLLDFYGFNNGSEVSRAFLFVNQLPVGILISKELPYQMVPVGIVTADFDHNAFATHLVENWDIIYASAVKRIEVFVRVRDAELADEERLLTKQISNCKKEIEEYLSEKEETGNER